MQIFFLFLTFFFSCGVTMQFLDIIRLGSQLCVCTHKGNYQIIAFLSCLMHLFLLSFAVTVADFISRAESQSRQNLPVKKEEIQHASHPKVHNA